MNLFTETTEVKISSLPEFAADHQGPYFATYETFAIKVFFKDDGYKFSTKRKENAFHSFWAERRSFGKLFLDEIKGICDPDQFFADLDKSIEYYFLVPLRGRNRVLLSPADEKNFSPTIFLAGITHQENTIIFDNEEQRNMFKGPWKYLPIVDPLKYNNEEYPFSIGVSHLTLGDPCRLVRFLLDYYLEYRLLRDNVPDILVRYGQLWKSHSPDISYFREHYIEYIEPFDKAVDEIYESYKIRYILKEFHNVSPIRHAVLKKIREIHMKRRWEYLSKNNVYNIIFKNFAAKLYKL